MKYPLLLKRGEEIVTENFRYTVTSVKFYEADRTGPFANRVVVETSTGKQLTFPLGSQVETR